MKKFAIGFLTTLLALAVVLFFTFFLGPKAKYDKVSAELPKLNIELHQLEGYISEKEHSIQNIKPDNASRIVWADSVRQTEYALVYLHGFSASPMEGAPLHENLARRYGMNLYLPRLSKHGIDDDDIFLELTPVSLMESAKEALVIGKKIGKKVILMSCSTGSTLGIYLTAHHPDIYAHLMYSPNIDIFDDTSDHVTGPWGEQILRNILGDYNVATEKSGTPDSVLVKIRKYWLGKYRIEGLIALQSLLDQTMIDEVFEKVESPYFMGFYFKDEVYQDSTVSVAAMYEFDIKNSTPPDKKVLVAFPEAGNHVINSPLRSQSYEEVEVATYEYVENTLGISPLK